MTHNTTDLEVSVLEIVRRPDHRDGGATAVEYALLVAFIALVIIVAVTLLGTNLSAEFSTMGTSLS